MQKHWYMPICPIFHLWHDCHYAAMSVRLMNGSTCLKIWDICGLHASRCHFSRAGKTTIERIACANSGDHPLKLNALLLPSCLKFYTEPVVSAPGQEGDLVITLDKAKLPSFHTEEKHLSLIIDGVIGKPSEKTIEVIIKN